jgi:hypothetical protein
MTTTNTSTPLPLPPDQIILFHKILDTNPPCCLPCPPYLPGAHAISDKKYH